MKNKGLTYEVGFVDNEFEKLHDCGELSNIDQRLKHLSSINKYYKEATEELKDSIRNIISNVSWNEDAFKMIYNPYRFIACESFRGFTIEEYVELIQNKCFKYYAGIIDDKLKA